MNRCAFSHGRAARRDGFLWSALGILLLFGIVKKNSILQVDYANVLRREGLSLHDAVVEASRTRLRPILMTTSAIIAGLVPTALGVGIGGTQRSAIATTIIGGPPLLEANSKEHAIQMAKEFLQIAGDGECEIREVFTAPTDASAGASDAHPRVTAQFVRA